MTSPLSTSDNVDIDESSWKIPFDVLLEIAAFCAGSFEFQSYLHLSLACKEVRKSLKPVLDEPFLVWDRNTPLWYGFCEARFVGNLKQYLRDVGKDLPNQAPHRSNARYVIGTTSTTVFLKPSLNRYLVIHDAWCFYHTEMYPLDHLVALFPRLRCVIGSGRRGDTVNCQTVLFEPVPVSTLANLMRSAASLRSSNSHQLHPEIASPATIKTLYLDFTRIPSPIEYSPIDLITVRRPVCDNVVVSADSDKPSATMRVHLEKASQLALFYSPLSKTFTAELKFHYWSFYAAEHFLFYVSAIFSWRPKIYV
jgi:hypothetical protein